MFGEPVCDLLRLQLDDIHDSWDLGPATAGFDENVEHGRVAPHDPTPMMITNGAYDLA
jgi:hypothetical protein